MDLKRSGSKKQNQKDLDDVLGDLLVEDSDFGLPKKEVILINRRPSKDRNKPSSRDDDFYSALASAAGQPDESDISEADVNQVANTLADLDDLDADLFGGKYNKKKSGPSTPRQRTPRTPRAVSPPGKGGLTRSSTPTSPPGTATGDRGRHTDRVNTPPQSIPKPSTAPGNIADLTRGSESLKPGEIKSDRPRTVPKAKPKFGEFDEDDPLAGLLSDEDQDLDEAKTITARSRAKGGNLGEDHTDSPKITSPRGAAVPHGVRERDPLSPRRQRLMDRPPTRSGDNNGVVDKPLDKLFEPAPDSPRRSSTAPDEGKVKKKDDVIFSDTEDDLLTGLEDNAPAKPQPATKAPEEATKPAKSVLDSLLGKDTVSKHLERPASASGKEFVLDKKYQKPQEEKDEEFLFGGYMPSMAGSATGSRPTSRRSVRFEESDDIFATPPSRGEGSMKMEKTATPASKDLDWLELAANGESGKKDATPSLPKTPESKKSGSSESDWLGLKDDKEETFDWLHSETVKPRSTEKTRNRPTPTQVEKTAVPAEQKTHTQPPKSLFEDDSYAFLHDGPSKSVSTPNKAATPKPPAPDSSDWLGLGKDPPLSGAAVSPVAGAQSKGRRASFATDPSPIFTDQIKQKDSHVNAPPVSVDQLMGVTGPIRGHTDPFVSSTPLPSAGPDSQHQAILQQQITHAQDQLRQQRAEQLRMQQEQEQLVLQQQQSQLEGMLSQLQQQYQANQMAKASIPTMGSITSHNLLSSATHKSIRLDPNYARMDLETKVRKLEIELECVESRCDSNQRRYQEELTAVELSYQNRMKVLDDSRKKMEDGWREETESQVAKHLSRVRQLEEERGRMERRVEQCERDRLDEVERVREAQRKMTAELKREYDESVERVRAVKNQEIDNIANSHSAAKSLQAVMQQISSNAKDLGELQCKVDTWNKMGLDEREIFVRTKDEQLRMLQERLDRQQEENGLERVRLQDLISRLERQLADQGRTLDEEKWRLKQEQGKLQSAQSSLEEERRAWLNQQARELSALDKAKDALLQEQKQILAQLYEERRSMAEDRSQLTAAQRALRESEQHHAVKYLKADAEYEVTMKSVTEERQRSETRQRELDKAEEHVRSQLASIESDRSKLLHEQSRVAQLALEVKQRSQELNAMAASASQTEEEGRKSLESAQRLEADHNHRASQIQAQLQSLRTKEKEIAEERVVLAREKKEVEQLRRSMLCVNCRTPVRDVGLNPQTQLVNGYVAQGSPSTPHRPSTGLKTPSGVVVTSPLPTDVLTLRNGLPVSANAVGAISASIEADKSVRMWKIQAEKDKEYLMSESMFLETLKQSPYNSSRLTS